MTTSRRNASSSLSSPRIVYILGARPNFVKMAPVISALRELFPDGVHTVVHTGQHYDRLLSQTFIDELHIPDPTYMLGVGSASHAIQTARIMERLEPVLQHESPDLMVVPGDVNSTLAATLVAVKLGIAIAHIEGGLRSFDPTMPEEVNRIVTDRFSKLIFVHCEEALENLAAEGIGPCGVHFVGNTMIDSLVAVEGKFGNLNASRSYELRPGDYLLVTLHRPALVDTALLREALDALEKVARELPVLFPMHPRTRKALGHKKSLSGVQLTDPIGYLEFLSLEADAAAVLTDSGGVQEETTYLRVPCFTLRANTERPVTTRLGTNTLLGLLPGRICEIPRLLEKATTPPHQPPLWDGEASGRVATVVDQALRVGQGSHIL